MSDSYCRAKSGINLIVFGVKMGPVKSEIDSADRLPCAIQSSIDTRLNAAALSLMSIAKKGLVGTLTSH